MSAWPSVYGTPFRYTSGAVALAMSQVPRSGPHADIAHEDNTRTTETPRIATAPEKRSPPCDGAPVGSSVRRGTRADISSECATCRVSKARCIRQPDRMWCSARAAVHSFALLAPLCLWASHAAASDPSTYVTEILTPLGWELYGQSCGAEDRPDISVELRIPDGWGHSSNREEPRWGGGGCSEVILPIEWSANESQRSSGRQGEFQTHSNNL